MRGCTDEVMSEACATVPAALVMTNLLRRMAPKPTQLSLGKFRSGALLSLFDRIDPAARRDWDSGALLYGYATWQSKVDSIGALRDPSQIFCFRVSATEI